MDDFILYYGSINNIFSVPLFPATLQLILGIILSQKSMVFVCTAMGVSYVEYGNVLELCYIELLSGDGSPYSILSVPPLHHVQI